MVLKPRVPPAKHSSWQRKDTEGLCFFIVTQKIAAARGQGGLIKALCSNTAVHAAQNRFRLRCLCWFSLDGTQSLPFISRTDLTLNNLLWHLPLSHILSTKQHKYLLTWLNMSTAGCGAGRYQSWPEDSCAMQRQESTSCNSSATYFPSSLPSAKRRRQQETFFQETFVCNKGSRR